MVWGTVKDHQGYIDVQSEEEKGNTFTLYFPVTREKISTEPVRVPISEYLGKGETILIVDDVKGQRDLAEERLKKLNYNVTSVSGGEEAVAYLKEHKADLLVLDMIMDPGMDGLETYRRIPEIPPQLFLMVCPFRKISNENRWLPAVFRNRILLTYSLKRFLGCRLIKLNKNIGFPK